MPGGRPKLPDDERGVLVSVRIPAALLAKLDERAQALGLTRTAALLATLARSLRRKPVSL
jgi:hypothetical protein